MYRDYGGDFIKSKRLFWIQLRESSNLIRARVSFLFQTSNWAKSSNKSGFFFFFFLTQQKESKITLEKLNQESSVEQSRRLAEWRWKFNETFQWKNFQSLLGKILVNGAIFHCATRFCCYTQKSFPTVTGRHSSCALRWIYNEFKFIIFLSRRRIWINFMSRIHSTPPDSSTTTTIIWIGRELNVLHIYVQWQFCVSRGRRAE